MQLQPFHGSRSSQQSQAWASSWAYPSPRVTGAVCQNSVTVPLLHRVGLPPGLPKRIYSIVSTVPTHWQGSPRGLSSFWNHAIPVGSCRANVDIPADTVLSFPSLSHQGARARNQEINFDITLVTKSRLYSHLATIFHGPSPVRISTSSSEAMLCGTPGHW